MGMINWTMFDHCQNYALNKYNEYFHLLGRHCWQTDFWKIPEKRYFLQSFQCLAIPIFCCYYHLQSK